MTVKKDNEKFCFECGGIINFKAEICPKCGVRQLGYYAASNQDKSKGIAGVLAILLGSFGVHKFYLGLAGQGIFYLLFCWTWIPMLLGLIEGIMFLATSEEEFDERFNS